MTDADAFARELRSGMYSTYAILSEQIKLNKLVQKKIREAVFRGEGLLLAGSHDNRNHAVFDALGVKLHGVLSDVNGISFNDPASGQTVFLPLPMQYLYPAGVERVISPLTLK